MIKYVHHEDERWVNLDGLIHEIQGRAEIYWNLGMEKESTVLFELAEDLRELEQRAEDAIFSLGKVGDPNVGD